MRELINKKTGDPITPESIEAELKAMGINEKGEFTDAVQADEKEEKADVAEEKETKVLESTEVEDLKADVEESAQLSTLEQEAIEKGWKPDGPKTAEEFLRAEPLYDELKNRGKKLKEKDATIEALNNHVSKLTQKVNEMITSQEQQRLDNYNLALEEMQKLKSEAIERGDSEAVSDIESKMSMYQAEIDKSINVSNPVNLPEVEEFAERNHKWINDPSYEAQQMREFAKQRDVELAQFNLQPGEHLKTLEQDLKKKFPDYFKQDELVQSEQPKATVESSNSTNVRNSHTKGKLRFADLSPEQKICARHFAKNNIMSIDDYIKQIQDLGEV